MPLRIWQTILFPSPNPSHRLLLPKQQSSRPRPTALSKKPGAAEESPANGGGQSTGIFLPGISKPLLAKSAIAVIGLGFVDAGYSGDWSRIGAITQETEDFLKLATFIIVPLCLLLIYFFPGKEKDSD